MLGVLLIFKKIIIVSLQEQVRLDNTIAYPFMSVHLL